MAEPPRVAFAIGRAIGPAVVRNRLRRRLREMLRVSALPPGWYLIGARPSATGLRTAELQREVDRLTTRILAATKAPVGP